MKTPIRIPVLYFDKDGLGPDELALEVFPLSVDEDMPAAMTLRVRAAGLVMRSDIDGGYFMHREQATALRDALDAWLKEVP